MNYDEKKVLTELKKFLTNNKRNIRSLKAISLSMIFLILIKGGSTTKNVKKPTPISYTSEDQTTEIINSYFSQNNYEFILDNICQILGVNKASALSIEEEVPVEPVVSEKPFSFSDLSIIEKQEYILNTYGIAYQDIVDAVSQDDRGIKYDEAPEENWSPAHKIRAREDFPEIKALFQELTQEKEAYVLERYYLTPDDFATINMVGVRETGGYNYNEGYNFASTLYNRIHCQRWITEIEKIYPKGTGYSIMYQLNHPGQYPGRYFNEEQKAYKSWASYYAIIDMLLFEQPSHNYCSYRSAASTSGVQLEPRGNKYHYEATDWVENPTLVEVTDIRLYAEDENKNLNSNLVLNLQ